MPSDHRSHAAADQAHKGKTLGKRLHRFLVPVPKLEPPINPALLVGCPGLALAGVRTMPIRELRRLPAKPA
jgi:hypothetical protein